MAIVVVVVDELGRDPAQVGLADRNHVVEAFLTDRPDPALGYRVGTNRQLHVVGNLKGDSALSIRSIP
jgi:hypothetical protein